MSNDSFGLGRQLENCQELPVSATDEPRPGASPAETEDIFRQVICQGEQAVWVSDADSQQILYLSPLHEQIWGRPLKELYESQSSWTKTIHPDDLERVLEAALEEGGPTYDQQYRILRPDGEVRWIRDRAFPIKDEQQRLRRIAGTAEDITDRKNAGEQLETVLSERTEELAWANLALETEASERRSAETQLQETAGRLQKVLRELCAAQRHLVRQEKTDLSDPEFDRERADTGISESADLLVAVREVIVASKPFWHDKALAQGRRIAVEQDFRPVPAVACREEEIREAVTSLFLNAVAALPEGGKIVIRAYSEEGNGVVEIQDDGVGMSEEMRTRCTAPRQAGDRSGTGIGLVMVYGMVQRHRGRFEIQSKLGEGTLVRLRLPLSLT
jgi:PAS domain S-box-containing protein